MPNIAPLVVALASLALATPLVAQSVSPASVAAAERAFAKMSVDSGQYAAFRANLDARSVVFRPRATNGATWYAEHPPRAPQGMLFWTPAFVGVARSNDLGFSTGPFRVDARRPNGDSVHAGGVFATMWGRRAGEPWRVLVDLGVGDSVVRAVDPTTVPVEARAGVAKRTVPRGVALAALLAADSALGAHYGERASRLGFVARASGDVRVLREGRGVSVGRDAVVSAAEWAGAAYRSTPIAGGVSVSRDLAYTYGTYTNAGPTEEVGNYLRVWRRDATSWRLVLDVASPVPQGS